MTGGPLGCLLHCMLCCAMLTTCCNMYNTVTVNLPFLMANVVADLYITYNCTNIS